MLDGEHPKTSEVTSIEPPLLDDTASNADPPRIKRAAITYGRRRDTLPAKEADTSSSALSSSSPSIFDSISVNTSFNTSADIPAPSEVDASQGYEWDWRQRLKDIDNGEDLDNFKLPSDVDASVLSDQAERKSTNPPLSTKRLPSVTIQSASGSKSENEPSQSEEEPAAGTQLVINRSALIPGSPESPCESSPKISPESNLPGSPSRSGIIVPTLSRSGESSPSISDDKLPLLSKTKGKGRGRGRSVPPLTFDDNQSVERKPRRNKIKPPTKKELRETEIQRARLKTRQSVIIPRTERKRHTLESFFRDIVAKPSAKQPSSDPIQSFSSPSIALQGPHEGESENIPTSEQRSAWDEDDAEEDDYCLPSIANIRQEAITQERAKQLVEVKKRALAMSVAMDGYRNEDEDDELVVVADGPEERKEDRKARLYMGGASGNPTGRRQSKNASIVEALRRGGLEATRRNQETATRSDLNRQLWKRVDDLNRKEIAKKEEEWVRRGGKLKDVGKGEGFEHAKRRYAEKAEQSIKNLPPQGVEEEDEDQEDGDYVPELSPNPSLARGSASPVSYHQTDNDGDVSDTETLEDDDDDDDDDKENAQPRPRATARRARILTDSDEDEADVRGPGRPYLGRVLVPNTSFVIPPEPLELMPHRDLVHRTSQSSFDTENDEEKENEKGRMWDKSEDKENKAVPRYEPLLETSPRAARTGSVDPLSPSGSIFDTFSPMPALPRIKEPIGEGKGDRAPLKDLIKPPQSDDSDGDEDYLLLNVSKSTSTPFLDRITQSQSTLVASGSRLSPPSPTFKPLLPVADQRKSASTGDEDRFSDADNVFKPLQPAFASLFEEGTQIRSSLGPKRLFESQRSSTSSESRGTSSHDLENLPLTLDVGLAPALEVNESKRKQADAIFEKEQEYLVEGFQLELKKEKRREPEVYVNDHGFLTQTRPDVSSPEVYRMVSPSPTPESQGFLSAAWGGDGTQRRPPLQTISLTSKDVEESSPPPRLFRLKKRGLSLAKDEDPFIDRSYRSSSSPGPTIPRNAFTVLADNALHRKQREKKMLERSDFVEAEAVESEDDESHGFAGFGKKLDHGEEENGEDLDNTHEELVDDREMSEEQVAKEKVLEKHQEQLAEDDKEIEKLHRDAIEGKFRTKRKHRGFGLSDDSDEDDDDEHDREIRRKMLKKRRIDGDTLDALGQNEETLAFYDEYHKPLVDDNGEFEYLQKDNLDMENDEDGNENEEPREVVSTHEIRKLIRAATQQGETLENFDAEDVSWADGDASDHEDRVRVRVQNTSVVPKTAARRPVLGEIDLCGDFEPRARTMESDKERQKWSAWASVEAKSRNLGTGRSTAGAAVTGHVRPRAKAGASSLQMAASSSRAADGSRPIAKARSMLSKVSDRSGRFA